MSPFQISYAYTLDTEPIDLDVICTTPGFAVNGMSFMQSYLWVRRLRLPK